MPVGIQEAMTLLNNEAVNVLPTPLPLAAGIGRRARGEVML